MLFSERFNGSRDGREDLLHHRGGGKYNLVDDRAIFAAKTDGGLGPSDVDANERADSYHPLTVPEGRSLLPDGRILQKAHKRQYISPVVFSHFPKPLRLSHERHEAGSSMYRRPSCIPHWGIVCLTIMTAQCMLKDVTGDQKTPLPSSGQCEAQCNPTADPPHRDASGKTMGRHPPRQTHLHPLIPL